MKKFRFVLFVLALSIVGFGFSADADSVFTSTLWTHGLSDGAGAACTVTNVSSSEISVSIQLIDAGGNVVDSKDTTLLPGKTDLDVGSVAQGNYYCKFTVAKSNKIRANLQILAQQNGVVFMRAVSEAK